MSRLWLIGVLGTAALASSCGGGTGAGGIPDAGGSTFGRLQLTLTIPQNGGMSVAAVGRLLRYRNVDAESAQVLAGGAAADAAPIGRCALIDPDANLADALAITPTDAVVQMLDAGEIMARLAGQTMKLSPRYAPEILPFVSGVVYDSDTPAVAPLEPAPREEALLTAFGGEEVGPFAASVDVPAVPHILSVAREAQVVVSWTRDGSGPVDVVLARDGAASLRCHVVDSGRFVVPADAWTRFSDGDSGAAMTVSVERSRRARFTAKGLAAGEAVVVVREQTSLPQQ